MSIKYEIWIKYGKEKLQIPVLPETIQIRVGDNTESIQLANLGEVIFRKGRLAKVVQFSSFFPLKTFQGSINKIKTPSEYSNTLQTWKNSKKPIKLIITAVGLDTYFRITEFTYEEKGGDVGTFYYSITFKEYRKVSVKKIKVNKKKKKKNSGLMNGVGRVNGKVNPGTYKVQKDDCLWNIAKKFYGDGSQYKRIYDANKKVIGSNPNKLKPGQILKIPACAL